MKLPFTGFFQDLHRFFAFKELVGLDIGTSAIKFVQLARGTTVPELVNYGILETTQYLERGNAAFQTSSLKLTERGTAEHLAVLVREAGISGAAAVASLPSFAVFTSPLEIPLAPPDETARLVSFQAKQFIPLPLSEVNLEWMKVEEFDNQRGARYQRLMVTAVPIATIGVYQRICRAAGLKLVGLELEYQALARAVADPAALPTLVIDIGAESTALAVMDHGAVRQTGQTDYGGAALTQALARSLGVSAIRAEELKRRRGLLSVAGEYDLGVSLTPFLDVILQECVRVRSAFEEAHHATVGGIMMVGGGANLPGIREYVEVQLGLPVTFPRPFGTIQYPPTLEPIAKSLMNELALSIGLGLKLLTPTP